MKDETFIQRLKKELPIWTHKGWVKKENQQHILNYVTHKTVPETNTLTFTFAWMGVILLSAGIITFFAANWGGINKITKLSILFGSLWLAYGLSYFFFHKRKFLEFDLKAAHLFLFLGLILFGANIWLIAQIYHIDAHYPNGVLIWSLAALVTAYLMRSPPALITSILLATLWTAMETFDFLRSVHWSFLALWILFLYPCIQWQWRISLHIALLSLLLWSFFIIGLYVVDLFVVQVYFLGALSVFLLGRILINYPLTHLIASTVQRYSAFAATFALFIPTFPLNITKERGLFFDIVPSAGYLNTLMAILLCVGLMIWLRKQPKPSFNRIAFILGLGLFCFLCLLMFINLILGSHIENHKGMIALGYNLIFFTGLGWIIYIGYHSHERFLINLGFVFFALAILARYFDTFWTLFNRSFFFITGGLLFTVGSYYFEKHRRKLTESIEEEDIK